MYQLCLTERTLTMLKIDEPIPQLIELCLTNVRTCGNLKNFFYLEVSTVWQKKICLEVIYRVYKFKCLSAVSNQLKVIQMCKQWVWYNSLIHWFSDSQIWKNYNYFWHPVYLKEKAFKKLCLQKVFLIFLVSLSLLTVCKTLVHRDTLYTRQKVKVRTIYNSYFLILGT